MPKENFYPESAVEGDDTEPHIVIRWATNTRVSDGRDFSYVTINNEPLDRSALNRLIRVLRTARDKSFGRDE